MTLKDFLREVKQIKGCKWKLPKFLPTSDWLKITILNLVNSYCVLFHD